ncbi:class I SAM-dependent methyltransferase [Streptomyces sp. TP-A0356]|uniref:class I SAM-dependent methyltransferase n=1 Tax=Streptomyces sp. TP-A0356 TaxID=1359208 RepID=UPI00099F0FCB|nr:class I SAM-dependent methyltransferase [Streptomyces sp. TP-A0356]
MATTASQEAFLKAFHAEHPALTADVLGRARACDGRTSYRILCDRVAECRRVLELGCGDGLLLELLAGSGGRKLAGVDLSPDALAMARRRPALSGAALVEGRAQELPFADDGFDACVSHMALMLMSDMDQVAVEIARVLAPGGVFACVVGGGVAGGEAYERFRSLLRSTIAELPGRRIPVLGDARTRSRDGLDELLGPVGFEPVDWATVSIDLGGPAEEVWMAVSGVYDMGPLDRETRDTLREAFLDEARSAEPLSGHVPCTFRIHLATTRLGPHPFGFCSASPGNTAGSRRDIP